MNKRIIISESERQRILNLHTLSKNKINEQGLNFDNTGALKVPLTPLSKNITDKANQLKKEIANFNPKDDSVPPVTDRKIDCTSTKNPTRCKQKVLDVQVKINDKCTKITQKLVEDGVFGNNTLNAIKTCTGIDLSSSGKTPVNGVTTTTTTVASAAAPVTSVPPTTITNDSLIS